MPGWLDRVLATLIGDHRHYSIEHRLFNTISLLNAVANFGGAVAILIAQAPRSLCFLQLANRSSVRGFLLPLPVQGRLQSLVLAVFVGDSGFSVYQLSFQRRVDGRSTLLFHPGSGDRNCFILQGTEDHRCVRGVRSDNSHVVHNRAEPPGWISGHVGASEGCWMSAPISYLYSF